MSSISTFVIDIQTRSVFVATDPSSLVYPAPLKRVMDRAIENKRLNGQTSSLFLKKKGLETRSKGVSFLRFEAIIFMGSIVKTFMI